MSGVAELTDKDYEELRSFLARDRVANAYLLGDLDPTYLPYCTWYGNRDEEGALCALVLVYTGLRLPAVLTVAPPEAVASGPLFKRSVAQLDALLSEIQPKLPRQFWVHAWSHHRPVLDKYVQPCPLMRMIRMGLQRTAYQRVDAEQVEVRRLSHTDTADIMALYRHYPDHFFEPYQLESGLYFGVDAPPEDKKQIVAIAGIHVRSEAHDIAAIGNMVVHPDYRRRGYATAATTRLLDALFESGSLVTLNVDESNVAAIGTFEKFGFAKHHVYFEGRVDMRR